MTIVICDLCGLQFLGIELWRRYHTMTFKKDSQHYPRSQGGDCGYWDLNGLRRNKFRYKFI